MRNLFLFGMLFSMTVAATAQDGRILKVLPSNDLVVQDEIIGLTLSQPSWGSSFQYGYYGNANAELIDYLAQENTRKQLEFTDKQTKEYKELQKQYGKAYQKMYAEYPELKKKDLPKEARKELNRKVQLAGQKLRKEFSEKVRDTLVPHQVSMVSSLRFKQTVQMFGFSHAVSNSPFATELKVTDKQKKELAEIKKATEAAIRKKMAEMKAAAKAKMLKVLDAKQRKKLKEIQGDPSKSKTANSRL